MEVSLYSISHIKTNKKNTQVLSSITLKLYGQNDHISYLIIPDNHIAYVLDWVSTMVAGWPL